MRSQLFVLLAGLTLMGAALRGVGRSSPSDAELWQRFVQQQEPSQFDALVLRGAFGRAQVPELRDWLREEPRWWSRLRVLHPLEARGVLLRERLRVQAGAPPQEELSFLELQARARSGR